MLGTSDDKVVVAYNGFSFVTGSFLGSGYYVLYMTDLTSCSSSPRVVRVAPDPGLSNPHPAQSLTSTSDLYLAGGDLFPTGSCVNPTLTLLALAWLTADHIVTRYG